MEKQITNSSQNFNTPFITDMTEICQKIKNLKINKNARQVQNNVIQIQRAVLNVAKTLEEKKILEIFEKIININVEKITFNKKGEHVVELPQFNILLRKKDQNTYDLISIKKTIAIQETNCFVMELKRGECSHLKKLAFLEKLNSCFGNLRFTTIFNKIIVPLSKNFQCKYIYLEDQSYFFKPDNKSPERLYVDTEHIFWHTR